jgi:hypothetical protein
LNFSPFAGIGVTRISATSSGLTFSVDQIAGIVQAGIVVTVPTGDKIVLTDSAQDIAKLTPTLISQLRSAGVSSLSSNYGGAVILDSQQVVALEDAQFSISCTLQDTAGAIQQLTPDQLAGLKTSGVSAISVTDASVSLSVAQAVALEQGAPDIVFPAGSNGASGFFNSVISGLSDFGGQLLERLDLEHLGAPPGCTVAVSDSPGNIASLSPAQIEFLGDVGIDAIKVTSSSVTLDLGQVLALAAAGLRVSASSGNQVILQDTVKDIDEGLTLNQIAAAGEAGITVISAPGAAFNVAQAKALEQAGIELASVNTATGQLSQNGVLLDTGDNIASLQPNDIASLSAVGITQIIASDGTVTLKVPQVVALEQAGITITSGINLQDEGLTIQDMLVAQLEGLLKAGVTGIGVNKGTSIVLTPAQVNVLAEEGLTVEALYTAASAEMLSSSDIATLASNDVNVITAIGSPTALAFDVQDLEAFIQNGIHNPAYASAQPIQIEDPSGRLIPLTLVDTVANLQPIITLPQNSQSQNRPQIQQFEDLGVTAEVVRDTAANLISLSASTVQEFETQALDPLLDLSGTNTDIDEVAQTGIAALSNDWFAISDGDQLFTYQILGYHSNALLWGSSTQGGTTSVGAVDGSLLTSTTVTSNKIIYGFDNQSSFLTFNAASGSFFGISSVLGLQNGNAAIAWYNITSGIATVETVVINNSGSAPQAVDTPVSLGPALDTVRPAMASLPNGGFVVAWAQGQYNNLSAFTGDSADWGPLAVAFVNASGQLTSLNTSSVRYLYSAPAVAANASGDIIVAWYDTIPGVAEGVEAEIFTSSGNLVKSAFVVASTNDGVDPPFVAALADGNFIVVWVHGGNIDGTILNQDGVPLTAGGFPFQIDNADASSTSGAAFDSIPQVAATANGYIVSWDVTYSGGHAPAIAYKIYDIPPTPTFAVSDTAANINNLGTQIRSQLSADGASNLIGAWTVKDTAADIEALAPGPGPGTISSLIADGVQTIEVTDASISLNAAQLKPILGANVVIHVQVPPGDTVQVPPRDTVTLSDTAANIEALCTNSALLGQLAQSGVTSISATDIQLAINWQQAQSLVTTPIQASQSAMAFAAPQAVWLTDAESTLQSQLDGQIITDLASAGFTDIDFIGTSALSLSEDAVAALIGANMFVRVSEFAIGYPPTGQHGPAQRFAEAILSDNASKIEGLSPQEISKLESIGISAVTSTDTFLTFSVDQALALANSGIAITVPSNDELYVADSATRIGALTVSDIIELGTLVHSVNANQGGSFLDEIENAINGIVSQISSALDRGLLINQVRGLVDEVASQLPSLGTLVRTIQVSGSVTFDVGQVLALEAAGLSVVASIGSGYLGNVTLADTTDHIFLMSLSEIEALGSIGVDVIRLTDDASSTVSLSVAQFVALSNAGIAISNASGKPFAATILDTAGDIEALTPGQIGQMWSAGANLITVPVAEISATDGPVVLTVGQAAALELAPEDGVTLKVTAPLGDAVTVKGSATNMLSLPTSALPAVGITAVSVTDTVADLLNLTHNQIAALQQMGVTSWFIDDTAASLLNLTFSQRVELDAFGINGWTVSDSAADIEGLSSISIQTLQRLGVTRVISTNTSVTLTAAEAATFENFGITIEVPAGDVVAISDTNTTNVNSLIKAKVVEREAGVNQTNFTGSITGMSESVLAVGSPPSLSLPAGQLIGSGGVLDFSASNGNAISIESNGTASPFVVDLQVGAGHLTVVTQGPATVLGNGGSNLLISGALAGINNTLNTLAYQNEDGGITVLSATVSDGVFTATGTIELSKNDLGPNESLPAGQIVNGGSILFNPATNNAITVAESGSAPFTTTLSVRDGTLTVAPAGASVVGDGAAELSLEGSASAINATLATLTYRPDQNFVGTDDLAVTTSDGTLGRRPSGIDRTVN